LFGAWALFLGGIHHCGRHRMSRSGQGFIRVLKTPVRTILGAWDSANMLR
jgi:hypothetical protein